MNDTPEPRPGAAEPGPAAPADGPTPKPIIYACSGCSDAGELADQIARRLSRSGLGEMSCLAGIGGRVKSILNKGEKAQRIFVVDGCPLNCARKTLELAGIKQFEHLGLHEIGLRKGQCPVSEQNITAGVDAARKRLGSLSHPPSAASSLAPPLPFHPKSSDQASG